MINTKLHILITGKSYCVWMSCYVFFWQNPCLYELIMSVLLYSGIFCRHLMDLSPVGSRFNNMVVSGELRNYFTQEELKEMNQYIKESSSLSYSDIYDDATTMCSSYPNSRGQYIKSDWGLQWIFVFCILPLLSASVYVAACILNLELICSVLYKFSMRSAVWSVSFNFSLLSFVQYKTHVRFTLAIGFGVCFAFFFSFGLEWFHFSFFGHEWGTR